MHVRLFLDIGHVMTKIDWEEPTKIKTCIFTVCWGLKIYGRTVRKGKKLRPQDHSPILT